MKEYKPTRKQIDIIDGKEVIRRKRSKYSGYTKTEGVIYGRPKGTFKYSEEELIALGEELVQWFEADPNNLFFEEFFQKRGLYRDFIRHHIDQSNNFKRIIVNAREIQERKLITATLVNRYNPALPIFWLKNREPERYKDDPQQSNGNRQPGQTNIIINLPQNFDKAGLPPETIYTNGQVILPDTNPDKLIPLGSQRNITEPPKEETPEPPQETQDPDVPF